MRTNHGTLAALDTGFRIPHGNFQSEIALLPLRGTGGERPIAGESADRDFVAPALVDRAQHFALELRRLCREGKRHLDCAADLFGNSYFEQMRQGLVHSLHILLDDLFALAPVGVANRFADGFDRLLTRQHLRNGEEADLQDRIHAAAHAGIACDLIGIDHEQLRLLRDQLLLHDARQMVPDFLPTERAIEQERPTRHQCAQHVVALEEDPLVAGDKVCLGD